MSWTGIRPAQELRALAKSDAYVKTVSKLRDNADYWVEHFEDSADIVSGWGHNYVCPKCAAHLKFDPEKPFVHVCTDCGTVAENTKEVLEAWTYYRRSAIGGALGDAALMYMIEGDVKYRRFVLDVIGFYADHYMAFDEHGKYAGRGKVMGQSLDEAVWGIQLLHALSRIGFDGLSEEGQRFHKKLFLPASRLCVAQSNVIHNIPLWHASFAAASGAFFGDERLLQQSIGGDLGAQNQVLMGFTPDGLWYENSTTYHFYSLEASTHLCFFLRAANKDAPEIAERVIRGYTAPLALLFENGTMTAFNDGWKEAGESGLAKRASVYLRAARLFEGMDGADDIAAALDGLELEGTLGALLYGLPERKRAKKPLVSANLPNNCMAMLRGTGIEAFVKYGNLWQSHAHPDALEICIPPFAKDTGTTGYGSTLHREWYTKTASHATFVVDGQSQNRVARGTGEMTQDGKTLVCKVDNAYPGVSAVRRIEVEGCEIRDSMNMTADREHTMDWLFHGAGEFTVNGELLPAELPEKADGYAYFSPVREWRGERFSAVYRIGEEQLTVSLSGLESSARVFIAESPDNPGSEIRHSIIVRTQGARASVLAIYRKRGIS